MKYSPFFSRFNLSFQASTSNVDDSGEEMDETAWPCFSTIPKATGMLDKELAASGFTRKDQDDIEMVCCHVHSMLQTIVHALINLCIYIWLHLFLNFTKL